MYSKSHLLKFILRLFMLFGNVKHLNVAMKTRKTLIGNKVPTC